MLLGVVVAVGWLAWTPATYTATTAVLLTPVPTFVDVESGREPRLVTLDTDAQLLTSAGTERAVSRAVGIDVPTVETALSVSAPALTRVLRVSFTASDPTVAMLGSRVAARHLISARRQTLAALQPQQVAVLQVEVADRDAELRRLEASGADVSRRRDLQDRLATLRARLAGLYAARGEPGRVLRAAVPAERADPGSPEVALASGAMLGLVAGCALGLVRDRRQRPRRISSESTSSPKRSAAWSGTT